MAVRAWVADAPGGPLSPETLELDEIRPGEVLVRVAAVGICHTDIAYTDGSRPAAPFPLVAGHEGAGVIAAVGPGTEGFSAGDRVVMSSGLHGTVVKLSDHSVTLKVADQVRLEFDRGSIGRIVPASGEGSASS